MHRPEGVLREGIGAQAVLVAYHHKLVIGELADGAQRAEGAGHKHQLFESINLLIRRFLDDGAVAVDEKSLFLHVQNCLRAARSSSFSAGVPMVMRRQFSHIMMRGRLRTMIPCSTSAS